MKNFIKNLGYSKSYFIGFGVIAFISILYLFSEIANNKLDMIDFKVYYYAAKNLMSGENLYGVPLDNQAHYIFKYSPAAAVYFIPFTLFPFAIAKYIYWLFLTGTIVLGFYLCLKLISPAAFEQAKQANRIILIAILPLVLHFTRELHLGQINHIILVLYILSLWFLIKGKHISASLFIAISIFIKPFGLILLPYFIYKRFYKAFLGVIIWTIAIGLIPLVFWHSWYFFKYQYWIWHCELLFEMEKKQELNMPEIHTIFSVLVRYSPLRWISFTEKITLVYQLLILGFIGSAFLYFLTKGRDVVQNKIIAEYGILIALIPLLAFTTANAFGFVQILVFIIIVNFKSLNLTGKVLSIVSFVFIGGACSDIIGKKASFLMDDLSLVSIGTIILIVLTFGLRKRQIV